MEPSCEYSSFSTATGTALLPERRSRRLVEMAQLHATGDGDDLSHTGFACGGTVCVLGR